MIALISAFEYISQNAIGEEVQVYSDSLGALAFRVNGYWKSSLSDTKKHLRIAYAQACQTSTIQLIHVHGHRGIWQNEYADKAAKNALKTLTTTNVNADISQADSFARVFYLSPPSFVQQPIQRTITKQTRSILTRASSALATFLAKMMRDCGYSRWKRSLFTGAAASGDRGRLCNSERETSQDLWELSGLLASRTGLRQFYFIGGHP